MRNYMKRKRQHIFGMICGSDTVAQRSIQPAPIAQTQFIFHGTHLIFGSLSSRDKWTNDAATNTHFQFNFSKAVLCRCRPSCFSPFHWLQVPFRIFHFSLKNVYRNYHWCGHINRSQLNCGYFENGIENGGRYDDGWRQVRIWYANCECNMENG